MGLKSYYYVGYQKRQDGPWTEKVTFNFSSVIS